MNLPEQATPPVQVSGGVGAKLRVDQADALDKPGGEPVGNEAVSAQQETWSKGVGDETLGRNQNNEITQNRVCSSKYIYKKKSYIVRRKIDDCMQLCIS